MTRKTLVIVGAGFCGSGALGHTPASPACAIGGAHSLIAARWKLNVDAGRIESAYATGNQLRMLCHPRGGNSIAVLTVDAIINATGPDYAVDRGAVPLLNSLRAIGLVSPDELNLASRSIAVTEHVRSTRPAARVRPADGLFHRECCTWRCRCAAVRRARPNQAPAPGAPHRNRHPKRKCPDSPNP